MENSYLNICNEDTHLVTYLFEFLMNKVCTSVCPGALSSKSVYHFDFYKKKLI